MRPKLRGVGVASGELSTVEASQAIEWALELEGLGFTAIWVNQLDRALELVAATDHIAVGTSVISMAHTPPSSLCQAVAASEAAEPGRLVIGLGGAPGPRPLAATAAYLDRLDANEPSLPSTRRLLGALGPKMLELAGRRAAGAIPSLVTPAYTRDARRLLGADAVLCVQQFVSVDSDPGRARDTARLGPLGFLRSFRPYADNFRRMGFSERDIDDMTDALTSALVACGDPESIAAQVNEHITAGADHVSLAVNHVDAATALPEMWRRLSSAIDPDLLRSN